MRNQLSTHSIPNLIPNKTGHYRQHCSDTDPEHRKDKCININADVGVWFCHRCAVGGRLGKRIQPLLTADTTARAADQKRRDQKRAMNKARRLFEQACETGSSPYLERKQVAGYGVRFDGNGTLLIPARNAVGQLLTVQRIFPSGDKRFVKDAPKKGGYHLIQGDSDGPILLAEGYATAASLHEATGHTSVCAFDLGNLEPVLQALRTLHPGHELILCADNDNPNPKSPTPGMLEAIRLGRQHGCRVAWPEQQGTDFNDLHVAAGLDAVRQRVEQAQTIDLPERGKRSYKQQLPLDLQHLERCSHPLLACWIARKIVARYLPTCPRQHSLADLLTLIENAAPAGTDLTPARKLADWLYGRAIKQAMAPVSINLEAHPEVVVHRIDSLDEAGEQIAAMRGVHIVKAPMASGKTKHIGGALSVLSPSMVAVAHSRALVSDLSRRLGLVSYTDVETQDDAAGCMHLGVCVNSLIAERLQPALDKPHTVFIDEATQVVDGVLTGDHVHNRAEVYAKLGQVSTQADTLVLADADANDLLLKWLMRIRPGETIHIWLMPEDYAHITLRHRRDGKPVQTALELADAGPLLVCVDSKEQAATLYRALQDKYPDCRGLLITADTTGEPAVRAFMRNPSRECTRYGLVVYSPAISSGVSIEVPHFTQHLAVYTGTVTPSNMLQMMRRDRTARQIELVLEGHQRCTGSGDAHQLLHGVLAASDKEKKALLKYVDDLPALVIQATPFDVARATQQAANNRARKAPHNDLLLMAGARGFSMATVTQDSGDGSIDREARRQNREQFNELLLSAPDIDDDTATRIREGRCPMTPERAMELHRYQCKQALAVDVPTLADAELYDRGAIVPRINRLLLLHTPDKELAQRDFTTLGAGVSNLNDMPTRLAYQDALANLLADLGIDPATLDGEYTAADAERVRQDWLPWADELAALGIVDLPPHEPANKTRWVTTLLRRLGLRAMVAKQTGPRGDRTRVYQVDPGRRATLLAIVARRLVHDSHGWGGYTATTSELCTEPPAGPPPLGVPAGTATAAHDPRAGLSLESAHPGEPVNPVHDRVDGEDIPPQCLSWQSAGSLPSGIEGGTVS